MRRGLRISLRVLGVLGLAWLLFAGLAFRAMSAGPEAIGRFMAPLPMPLMMVMPFRTLWNVARAGTLAPGDEAPDFELPTLGGGAPVRLSSFRGDRPVVLIFGSYT